jgi:uncharacterized SAM-binding protein YcdF (DUF218 family)
LAIVAAVLAGLYFTSGWWLAAAGRWLDVSETPHAADFCLVLSGDFESRPFAAAALYRKGFIHRGIWLTQIAPDTIFPQGFDSETAARRILEATGVPGGNISVLEGQCATTFDEAQALKRQLAKYPDATVAVVTSDYHTRRSRWVFRQVIGDAADRLQFVAAPTDYFNADNWWRVEEGIASYPKEFFKLPFYYIWYGPGLIWLGAIGIVVVAAWVTVRIRRRRRPVPLSLP